MTSLKIDLRKPLSRRRKQGSILIAVLFMMFLFFTAASLLFFTIAHSRIMGARSYRWLQTAVMRQDLVRYLHDFREKVCSEDLNRFQLPETEYFSPDYFPIEKMEGGHTVTPSFDYYYQPEEGFTGARFKRTRLTASFDVAHGYLVAQGGHPYRCHSEAVIDLFDGDIPLMFFPVFVGLEKGKQVIETEFFKEKGVVCLSNQNPVADDGETVLEYDGIIRGSFNIPAGEVVLWPDIRRKLGLEPSEQPLDDGIYLVVEGPWVRTLFIQGNVDAMVFFILPGGLEPVQGVRIIRSTISYEILYKPGREYFRCPDPGIGTDKFFFQRIIVNGSIGSMEQEGDAAFCPLTRIMVLASGPVVIRSNLETAGGQVNLGSVTLANMTLAAGFGDVFSGEGDTGNTNDPSKAAVTVDTPGTAKIRANIVADGTFENKNAELKLEGSLFCRDIRNQGKIELTHLKPSDPDAGFFRVIDLKYIYQFFVSCIEEVSID